MKRVLFNVPKWHLLLHREYREPPLPKDGDDLGSVWRTSSSSASTPASSTPFRPTR
jgi:hypothetical protein